jgi:hypothetical protein
MKNPSERVLVMMVAAIGFSVCSCTAGVRDGDNTLHAVPDGASSSWVTSMPEPAVGSPSHP